jgi:hypothetical protein
VSAEAKNEDAIAREIDERIAEINEELTSQEELRAERAQLEAC